jgi:hypothetical protein
MKAATYERLAIFTGIPASDLHAATIHHYAIPLTLPHDTVRLRWMSEGNLLRLMNGYSRDFRVSARSQFCPACLKEAACHRLIWTPIAIAACLRHQCLLVNRCPQCEKAVSIETIIKAHCQTCGTHLSETSSPALGQDAFGLFSQQMLWAWLEQLPPPRGAWAKSMPEAPCSVLYGLVRRLNYTLLHCLDHQALVPSLREKAVQRSVEEIPWVQYELNRLAFRAILEWPESFLELMTRMTAEAFFSGSRLSGYVAEPTARFWPAHPDYWAQPEFSFVRSPAAPGSLLGQEVASQSQQP